MTAAVYYKTGIFLKKAVFTNVDEMCTDEHNNLVITFRLGKDDIVFHNGVWLFYNVIDED